MINILKVVLLAVTVVAGSSALAVAAPYATRHQGPSQSFTDQYGEYQPVSPPPWAW